jgi:hypothetical protein
MFVEPTFVEVMSQVPTSDVLAAKASSARSIATTGTEWRQAPLSPHRELVMLAASNGRNDMRWILLLLLLVSCGAPQRTSSAVAPSGAAIAIEVVQNSVLAGGFQNDLAAKLRQTLLESGAGVPMADAAKADLRLQVTVLGVNFSNATSWEWQLIDVDSGAIVASGTDTAAMGRNAGPLANEIIGAVAALDLAPYTGGNAVVAAAAPAPEAATNPASATDGSNAWAVVFGIEEYREGLPAVAGGEADARAFAEYARATLNVPESNIKVLLGERASRADMTGALTEWLPRNATKPGGRVYVFFAGHGGPDIENGSAYLLPYDANPTYIKSSGFAVQALQEQLAALEGQQVYVFLDACFSGTGERSVLPEGTRPLVPVQEVKEVGGVVTFAASKASEATGATEGGQSGLFSHHLLEGLRGAADADADASVSVAELQAYVDGRVQTDARRQNREQTPTLTGPANTGTTPIVNGLKR